MGRPLAFETYSFPHVPFSFLMAQIVTRCKASFASDSGIDFTPCLNSAITPFRHFSLFFTQIPARSHPVRRCFLWLSRRVIPGPQPLFQHPYKGLFTSLEVGDLSLGLPFSRAIFPALPLFPLRFERYFLLLALMSKRFAHALPSPTSSLVVLYFLKKGFTLPPSSLSHLGTFPSSSLPWRHQGLTQGIMIPRFRPFDCTPQPPNGVIDTISQRWPGPLSFPNWLSNFPGVGFG